MPAGIDGERGISRSTPSPLPPSPGKGDMVLKVRRTFGARVKIVPLFWFAGRPEVVPYIRALGGVARVGGDALACPLSHLR